MGPRARTIVAGVALGLWIAGCSPQGTTISSSHDTEGTLEECCSVEGAGWETVADPVPGNQARLALEGRIVGFMELRARDWSTVSATEGLTPIRVGRREALFGRIGAASPELSVLVRDANAHGEHLAVQVQCASPACDELGSLVKAMRIAD